MTIADELIALLGFEMTGEAEARRYERMIDGMQNRLQSFAKAAAQFGVAAGGAVLAAGGFLGRSVVTTSAEYEKFSKTLKTIEGSEQAAQKSLDWIEKFAANTPGSLESVTESFIKLKAYGIDPIANDTLRILGDTGAAMSKTMNSAVEALADAATGEFERLKEFGVKARVEGEQVTFSWQKNGEEIRKTVQKNSEEISSFVLGNFGDRFSGAMAEQASGFNGMLSNIGDSWSNFQRRIGDAGFFDSVKAKMKEFMDFIARADADGRLDQWADNLSKVLTTTLNAVEYFTTRIGGHINYLIENWDKLKGPIRAVGLAFGALLVTAMPVVTGIVALGLAVDDLLTYLQGGDSVIGDFIDGFRKLLEVEGSVTAAIGQLADNIMAWIFGRFALVGERAVEGMKSEFSKLYEKVFGGVEGLDWAAVGSTVGRLIFNGIKTILGLGPIVSFFRTVASWVEQVDWTSVGASMGNSILNGLKSLGSMIRDWILGQIPEFAQGFFSGERAETEGSAGRAEARRMRSPSVQMDTPRGADEPKQAGVSADQVAALTRAAGNMSDNLGKMSQQATVDATLTDARQDNRSFPSETTVNITQNVQQASQAPERAAEATGGAVRKRVRTERAQVESEPSF